MRLGGLQKMTLLDFPGRVACTVFTAGCNFRCPFCHNTPLVISCGLPAYPLEDFFSFLEKRKGLLDGVAVTGGEPLLQPDIEDFLSRIHDMGFAVKLDTNGAFPQKLQRILAAGLVDYVAMDIKSSKEHYELAAGVKGILPDVEKSVSLLLEGKVPYEFRTTLVDALHTPEDFRSIGRWLCGAQQYFIQGFVDSGNILAQGMYAADAQKTAQCLIAVRESLPQAQLRGQ